ncbi:cytochrome P450 [Raphidocelis subcapitata]|uniref:Cytochrome P450 n=1 Tax=Raphidocelis subcapitata TaxID=307507 RepID=A0A2V0P1I3_9CHLO|nr:cytochrome P450 [Raphidocelis subcapitata]|eukprot:GBF93726.1 cytochrome P450 [Raphidocelis subcapitata]
MAGILALVSAQEASWAFLGLSVALAALWLLESIRRPSHDLDKIPGPWRSALPVVGNVLECLRPDFHRVLLKWADDYGGIVRVKFLWKDALIVTDPAALATIMGRGEGALDKAAGVYATINYMCDPHGAPNLLTGAATDSWRAVRRAVAASFSAANIRRRYPLILGRINELVARVAAQGPDASIDVDQAALRVTLDVIGLAGFGHDYGSVRQDTPPYDHLLRVLPRCFTEVMLRIANPVRQLAPRMFKGGAKGRTAFAAFQSEMRILLEELKARGEPAADDQSIASQLYRVMRDHPEVTEDRVLSEIGILFVEGFETTGHTTAWTLLHAATAPGVQDRVAAELDAAGLLHKPGCPPPREMEYEDLKRLPYLTAVAKEAMRMLPVVSLMGRVAERQVKVGPYVIPAGTVVGTPLFAIHNAKRNWDAPHEFRPERWLGVPVETFVYNSAAAAVAAGEGGCGSEGAEGGADGAPTKLAAAAAASKEGITYMPFSDGPRSCVGQSLAKAEVMTLLVKILGAFKIELAPEMGGLEGVRARESTHLTLQTAGTKGIRMRMAPRSEAVAAGAVRRE